MADYSALEIEGLPANQKAYALENGTKAIVQIASQNQTANAWNAQQEAHVALHVSVWTINDDGSPKLKDGKKIGPPNKIETVLTSAIAEGTITLQNVMTQATIDALKRLSNWLVVQAQFGALSS